MFTDPSDYSSDLEWMLQSGQASEALIVETLVNEHYGPLYRLALAILNHTQAAHEAVARTFLSTLNNAYRYRSDFPIHLWLYRTALHTCRRLAPFLGLRRGVVALAPSLVPAGYGEPALPESEQEADLWLALDDLPAEQRLPIILRHVLDLPQADIARLLGVAEADGAKRLDRARHKLGKRLRRGALAGEDLEAELTRSLSRRWPAPELSPEDLAQVRLGIEARRAHKQRRLHASLSPRKVLLGAAALALVVALGWFSFLLEPEEDGSIASNRRTPAATRVVVIEVTARPEPTFDSAALQTAISGERDRRRSNRPGAFLLDLPATPLDSGFEPHPWRNSGPLVLSRVLEFWDQPVDLAELTLRLQPDPDDQSVMPYEIENYVEESTPLEAVYRIGGDFETLADLVSAGFPVILEKGFIGAETAGWAGHYVVATGYDQSRSTHVTLATSLQAEPAVRLSYPELEKDWQAFNYNYLVIYPPEDEARLQRLLGAHADEAYNFRFAAQKAAEEIAASSGLAEFYAWFNRGTSLTYLDDYSRAADAFDRAFAHFEQSSTDEALPYRMLWYQSLPYWAYYYAGRYDQVILLADATLSESGDLALEESYYWRALAKEALGDLPGAIDDLQQSVRLNPNFTAGLYQLSRLQGGS